MNILGITPKVFEFYGRPPPKKNFGKIFFGGGWDKEILGCFTGKSLYAQFNFTRHHSKKNFLPASQITWIYFDLAIGSLWAWGAVGMSNLFTYLPIL